jgi:alpha-L-fucosidase
MADWQSLQAYRVPAWYKDGKFGIFIHWGVYCVPAFANEWYPRNMYQPGSKEYEHHLATYGAHDQFGYKDFIPGLTAANYDPDQWAELFRKAGARFVVPVAEHHDGFAMYNCSLSIWNAVKMGPKRDLVGELAAAVRRRGLVFGLSSHRAEHWFFFDGGKEFPSDVQNPAWDGLYGPAQPGVLNNPPPDRCPDQAFLDDWLARTCELVDRYQPQIVWFDWWIGEARNFAPYLAHFAAYYYNRSVEWMVRQTPGVSFFAGEVSPVAINYKYASFPEGTAVLDVERGQLKDIRPMFWQTDTSVSKSSWGYTANQDYKSSTSIICDLVDIVSKNGALLLNIGPKPDGTIPAEEERILLEIGEWLAVNGEAIYGTRPWKVFGEGPTEVTEGAFTDTKRSDFTAHDLRFTRKGDTLYVAILAWPADNQVIIQSLGSNLRLYTQTIVQVEMLGVAEPLAWRREADGLHVMLPAQRPCDHAYVLKIAAA